MFEIPITAAIISAVIGFLLNKFLNQRDKEIQLKINIEGKKINVNDLEQRVAKLETMKSEFDALKLQIGLKRNNQ